MIPTHREYPSMQFKVNRYTSIFSLPGQNGQSPGRVIVLPPASVLALALASALAYVKVSR